jgi:hypothetical protein
LGTLGKLVSIAEGGKAFRRKAFQRKAFQRKRFMERRFGDSVSEEVV